MKKNYLLATALAITTLAGCTDDGFVGDQSVKEANGSGAISFNSGTPAITRADKTGAAAAGDLGGKFYVWGIKNENTDALAAAATGNLVYNNYVVEWADNSAMTSTSNTEGWEYVGKTLTAAEAACITTNGGSSNAQTIKYWDWGATDYTFYAFSAKESDLNATVGDAKVQVAKITNVSGDGKTVYDKGYTVTLAANADLDKLYFSERVKIERSQGSNATNTNRTQDNTYGGNVTFRFHNMASKVRVAMYETVPGHTVTINSFEVVDNASPTFATMTTPETGCFKANFVNNASGTAGTMTVKYVATEGATQNYPTVSFAPTSTAANILQLGDQLKANVTIGESATGATYDKTAKAYTSVFPKEDNTQNLKLKVNYTLTADGTSETITVEDATAEIPAAYLQWKPGYAYTYIFKISDNTNGSTGTPGTNPAGLYPITFDAVEAIADDGQAEYITTISEPSITTFGVKAGKYVHDGSEYEAGSDIYVTFMDGSSVVGDFTLNSVAAKGVNVYRASTTNATTYPITEASVAESIAEVSAKTKQVTVVSMNDDASTCFTAVPAKATEVPGEDGKCLSTPVVVAASSVTDASGYYTDKACTVAATLTGGYLAAGTYFQKWTSALKLTGVKATSATTALVVEYVKTPATYKGEEVTIADADAFTAAKAALNLYTDAACNTPVGDAAFSAEAHYYKKVVDSPGVYAYKVINVQ